jgi:hypothetical protein
LLNARYRAFEIGGKPDTVVVARGDIAIGMNYRAIPQGTRFHIDDEIVRENPSLFVIPQRELALKRKGEMNGT